MYFVSFWQWQSINYWDLGINSKAKFPGQARHNKVRLSLGIGRLGSEGFWVCVECLFLRTQSRAPYRTPPARDKRATYSRTPSCSPVPRIHRHSGTTGGCPGRPPFWSTPKESREGLGSVTFEINTQHTQHTVSHRNELPESRAPLSVKTRGSRK